MEDAMFDVCSDDDECIVRFQLREDDSDALPDMLDIARAVTPAPVNQSVASDLSAFVEERFPEYLSPLHEQTSSKSEKKIYGCEWEFLQHIDAFARVETHRCAAKRKADAYPSTYGSTKVFAESVGNSDGAKTNSKAKKRRTSHCKHCKSLTHSRRSSHECTCFCKCVCNTNANKI
jgi:hypothetical protein